jgi:type II secretory pathway pseudopilin PulG
MYKIIGADRKEYGPCSVDQIRQWIASGRCNGSTLARLDGTNAWKPLVLFPEFKSALEQLTGPAVPPRLPTSPAPASAPRNNVLLILGIVAAVILGGLVLIGLLAAIAIPNFVRARQQAQTNTCRAHLQQLSSAINAYVTSNGSQLPPATTWSDAISSYVNPTNIFQCPADNNHFTQSSCSFAFNKNLDGKKLNDVNSKTVLLFESDSGWNGVGDQSNMVSRGHRPARSTMSTPAPEKIFHVVLVDGSFVSVTESELSSLRWEP